MELADRLKLARQHARLTQTELAKRAGMTQQSYGALELGQSKRSAKLVELAAATGVDPLWLVTGQGEMLAAVATPTVSNDDATLTRIPYDAFRRIPVVGIASLGMDGFWTDQEYPPGHGDGHFEFPTRDRDAYVLQVRGNSMFPAIRSGWYVAVEPNKQPQMGEFVLVRLVDGKRTVKEFLWHRDGEYVFSAVSDGSRLVIPETEIESVQHVAGILPPSSKLP